MTIHVVTQYVWPDDAPTGIYAEQLADALLADGERVRLVGGVGRYREGGRPAPRSLPEKLPHRQGRRGRLASVALEYEWVRRAFARYLDTQVAAGDVVIVTSAPPTTLFLHRRLRRRGALGVYWLQDYYPQLVRAVWDPPAPLRRALARLWDRELRGWHHVVKAAGNLRYAGDNALVRRNWNTVDLGPARPARPMTALYSGNLGWGHHLPSFLELCGRLRDEGYEITVRGDGPGMASLPAWIRAQPPLADPRELVRSYWEAEVHLLAGHPDLPDAVFPSKAWNAVAAGRRLLASGFGGPMLEELEVVRRADVRAHLPAWTSFVRDLTAGRSAPERCR